MPQVERECREREKERKKREAKVDVEFAPVFVAWVFVVFFFFVVVVWSGSTIASTTTPTLPLPPSYSTTMTLMHMKCLCVLSFATLHVIYIWSTEVNEGINDERWHQHNKKGQSIAMSWNTRDYSFRGIILFLKSIRLSFVLPGDERVLTAGNDDVRARWPCVQFAAKATQSRTRRDSCNSSGQNTLSAAATARYNITIFFFFDFIWFLLKIPLDCAMVRFFFLSFSVLYATDFYI